MRPLCNNAYKMPYTMCHVMLISIPKFAFQSLTLSGLTVLVAFGQLASLQMQYSIQISATVHQENQPEHQPCTIQRCGSDVLTERLSGM